MGQRSPTRRDVHTPFRLSHGRLSAPFVVGTKFYSIFLKND
jgi:hypothetical protein